MAKNQQDPQTGAPGPLIDPNAPLPAMTVADLISIIAAATQGAGKQQADALTGLAAALVEMNKPRVDPQAELARANNEIFRKQSEEQHRRTVANRKAGEDACSHIAGNRGDLPDIYQRTSIVWHTSDVGITVGICTGCGHQFWPDDDDYARWRGKPSFCRKVSAGGHRTVFDHQRALDESRLRDS